MPATSLRRYYIKIEKKTASGWRGLEHKKCILHYSCEWQKLLSFQAWIVFSHNMLIHNLLINGTHIYWLMTFALFFASMPSSDFSSVFFLSLAVNHWNVWIYWLCSFHETLVVWTQWKLCLCNPKSIFPLIKKEVWFGDGTRGKTAVGMSIGIKAPLCKWF